MRHDGINPLKAFVYRNLVRALLDLRDVHKLRGKPNARDAAFAMVSLAMVDAKLHNRRVKHKKN